MTGSAGASTSFSGAGSAISMPLAGFYNRDPPMGNQKKFGSVSTVLGTIGPDGVVGQVPLSNLVSSTLDSKTCPKLILGRKNPALGFWRCFCSSISKPAQNEFWTGKNNYPKLILEGKNNYPKLILEGKNLPKINFGQVSDSALQILKYRSK